MEVRCVLDGSIPAETVGPYTIEGSLNGIGDSDEWTVQLTQPGWLAVGYRHARAVGPNSLVITGEGRTLKSGNAWSVINLIGNQSLANRLPAGTYKIRLTQTVKSRPTDPPGSDNYKGTVLVDYSSASDPKLALDGGLLQSNAVWEFREWGSKVKDLIQEHGDLYKFQLDSAQILSARTSGKSVWGLEILQDRNGDGRPDPVRITPGSNPGTVVAGVAPGAVYVKVIANADATDEPYHLQVATEEPTFNLQNASLAFDSREIKKDDGDQSPYTGPQWLDADGQPSSNDNLAPISYLRSSGSSLRYMRVTAEFTLAGSALKLDSRLQVKGIEIGRSRLLFEGTGTVNSEGLLSLSLLSKVALPKTLDNRVLQITWRISPASNAAFVLRYGLTSTKLYVYAVKNESVLNKKDDSVFHTVLELATRNTRGMSPEGNILAVTAQIWKEFSGRNVARVDGNPLQFWGPGTNDRNRGSTLEYLLSEQKGQCSAFSFLLHQIFHAAGVFSARVAEVTAKDVGARFLIKNFTKFIGTGSRSSPDEYRYSEGRAEFIEDIPSQAQGGVPLRPGTTTPFGSFRNHFLVRVSDGNTLQYFDPSFGSSPTDSLLSWEAMSVAGVKKKIFWEWYGRKRKATDSLLQESIRP